MNPIVSVIVPCFNAAPWLGKALDSVLAQTHRPLEIIVVDDGSSDESVRVARTYAAQGVQLMTQPNRGASAARNHGLRHARGDYVQFLDADDALGPAKIEAQVSALQAAPPDTLASGRWGHFTDDLAQATFNPETVYSARSGVEFLQLHFETGTMMQPGAWLAPRALLARIGPWDETLSLNDDGEYFSRVMLAARGILHVSAAECFYRRHARSSLSRRRDARALRSLHRSIELTLARLLAADPSPRSRAAAILGWRKLAYELLPDAPALAAHARQHAATLGGPDTPLGGASWVAPLARLIGWRNARRAEFARRRFA
jgi:glycosyltransferase involved in cell wall biosynthesis